MNEYLVIDSGGYLCTNNLHAIIAVWLDASREAEVVFDGTGLPGRPCQMLLRIEFSNNSCNTSIAP